jgi:poly(3-hydroxybutyrate) depolymerase
MTSGKLMITSGGNQRSYIIDVPTNYDMNKAYRLFFTFHWIGSTSEAVRDGQTSNGGAANWGYYGLKRMANAANDPAIFIAPQSMGSMWGQQDHPFFDDMLARAKEQLCIDTSRVFATGFSFGGMITYSLSTNHQKDLRAAVGIAPANYNIYLPTNTHEPIPWMSTTGMSDTTCPWDGGNNRGARYAAIAHAMDNGCTIPATIPTAAVGSRSHVCYDFQGCMPGYPVKACTFDGGHIAAHADGGTGDNGLTSWIPTESWKFFSQF